MLEKDLQKAVIQLARFRGWLVMHTRTVMLQSGHHATPLQGDKGFPDLVLCHPLKGTIFVELKSANGRCSKEQVEWLNALEKSGMEVYVWRPADWGQITARLESLPARFEFPSTD